MQIILPLISEFIESLRSCEKITLALFPTTINCNCSQIHDPNKARKLAEIGISFRITLLMNFFQNCHIKEALKYGEKMCSDIILAIFPINSQISDYRQIARSLNDPSFRFCIEYYISNISDRQDTFEVRVRMALLQFVIDAQLLGNCPLASGEVLYNLHNASLWNKNKILSEQNNALHNYISDGMEFVNFCFATKNTEMNPLRFLDIIDQFMAAFIGLATRFNIKRMFNPLKNISKNYCHYCRQIYHKNHRCQKLCYLPSSLIYKLEICKIRSYGAWSQRYMHQF